MGDALSSFFDHNPFSKWKHDRDYLRYCYKLEGMTDKQVDQKFADEDLGDELMKKINEKLASIHGNRYFKRVMCCSPRRNRDDLKFWVNDGGDFVGAFTEKQLRDVIETGKTPNAKKV